MLYQTFQPVCLLLKEAFRTKVGPKAQLSTLSLAKYQTRFSITNEKSHHKMFVSQLMKSISRIRKSFDSICSKNLVHEFPLSYVAEGVSPIPKITATILVIVKYELITCPVWTVTQYISWISANHKTTTTWLLYVCMSNNQIIFTCAL